MRAAAQLLLAGCGRESMLDVFARGSGISAQLIDADCSCKQRPLRLLHVNVSASGVSAQLIDADRACKQRPLALGECETFSDVSDGTCLRCESQCPELSAVRINDSSVLRLEGCGERLDLEIPTTFLARLVVSASAVQNGTRIKWQVDASTTSVFIGASGGFVGESCLVLVEPNSLELALASWLNPDGFAAIAHVGEPERETPYGRTRVTVSSAPATTPPPLR
ncbi:MAG: hypothetical protein JNL83_09460 [Myxococcales bacterium]|nr:hypothetical protein [Myxococcales bacterium]